MAWTECPNCGVAISRPLQTIFLNCSSSATSHFTVTGSGSIASTGGVGMSIGAGANARLAMQDTSSVSGSSAGVQDSGDLFLTMSDASTLSSTNGSALNVLAGASATVSTDRGTTITAAGAAPTIDVAGNAALTLRGTLSNTGTGAALQLESTAQAAIELDGQFHFVDHPKLNDRTKRNFAESQGIRVLRFENKLVFEDTEWVLAAIRSQFGWTQRTTPSAEASATPPS